MSEGKPLLEVRDLEKRFPVARGYMKKPVAWVRAVDGLSFSLRKGRTLAIVGESGCGKTTLAKMILRLGSPTSGKVLFDGKDVHTLAGAELRDYRTQVQAVFQDPWASLSPRMRVKDIISEPLIVNRSLKKAEVKRRVFEVLDAVGMEPEHASRYPHEFSGGQRQRISIASALVSQPRLIVLDEPVSALDVSIRSQIMNLFKDLQEAFGVAYLLIAHDLGTTRFMADDVAVMYLGQIVEKASSDSLFDNPQHPYTRALLSAAPSAKVGAQIKPELLEGELPSPSNPPKGCRFHTRCPVKIGAVCETIEPKLFKQDDSGHLSACHLNNSQVAC